MKPQTIKLTGLKQAQYANQLIAQAVREPDLWCCEIKKYKEAKTLQQLRALFGTWYDYLSDTLGETKDELHQFHKIGVGMDGGWLVKIYQENPQNQMQEMWNESIDITADQFDNFNQYVIECLKRVSRISLSWATIDQMREYMKRIEHYYLSAGYPLPVLEKFKRWYL